MPILIDGNNLLFAAHDADPDRPVGRGRLGQILAEWSLRTGEPVQVVFDGPAPPRVLAEQIGGQAIQVRYSGAGVPADDLVIREIDASSAPRRLVVVSSDREVARAARRRRCTAVRSDDFWSQVLAELSRPKRKPLPPEKLHGLSRDQADRWAREFGLTGDNATDSDATQNKQRRKD